MISPHRHTGELGYEIYTANENAPKLWKVLREAGEEFGLLPCGLGARDTLRLEAAMPLYGHEMDDTVTPLEAGLDFAVKLNKPEFIGKDALVAAGTPSGCGWAWPSPAGASSGSTRTSSLNGEKIGQTTSGTHCPYLGKAVAMALIDAKHAAVGTALEADVRGPPGGGGDRPPALLQAGLSAPALFDPLCDPKGFPCHPNNILMYGGENHV